MNRPDRMFLFHLAEDIFHLPVGELMERLTVDEYIYWQAFSVLQQEEMEHRARHGGG